MPQNLIQPLRHADLTDIPVRRRRARWQRNPHNDHWPLVAGGTPYGRLSCSEPATLRPIIYIHTRSPGALVMPPYLNKQSPGNEARAVFSTNSVAPSVCREVRERQHRGCERRRYLNCASTPETVRCVHILVRRATESPRIRLGSATTAAGSVTSHSLRYSGEPGARQRIAIVKYVDPPAPVR